MSISTPVKFGTYKKRVLRLKVIGLLKTRDQMLRDHQMHHVLGFLFVEAESLVNDLGDRHQVDLVALHDGVESLADHEHRDRPAVEVVLPELDGFKPAGHPVIFLSLAGYV